MDVRLGYGIPISTVTAELFGELFNATNRANFAAPSGDRRSTAFLIKQTLRPGALPRTAQFGVRMQF